MGLPLSCERVGRQHRHLLTSPELADIGTNSRSGTLRQGRHPTAGQLASIARKIEDTGPCNVSPHRASLPQQHAIMNKETVPEHEQHPWSASALLAKAQRYAEEMLRHPVDDWRFAFWAAHILEFLGRAALAKVSPTLLADARNWNNIYYALGRAPTQSKFAPKSVGMAEVVERLEQALPDFTPELAGLAAAQLKRRNEELHSGGTPLDGLGTSSWLPWFYELCDVLLRSLGESLEMLFGPQEARTAKETMEAARDKSAQEVKADLAAHRRVWTTKEEVERKKLADQASTWATKHDGHRVSCPACGSNAILSGSPAAPPTQELRDNRIIERQRLLPTRFECIACGLKVSGLSRLTAMGLGDSYTATFTYSPEDYFATEDPLDGYEPDFNEPDAY